MLAQGCSHLRAGLGLERPPPDAPLHSGAPHAQQVCAGVGETPRFLPTGTSPQGCWSVLTTCRLPVLRASQREQGESGLSPTIDLDGRCELAPVIFFTWFMKVKLL